MVTKTYLPSNLCDSSDRSDSSDSSDQKNHKKKSQKKLLVSQFFFKLNFFHKNSTNQIVMKTEDSNCDGTQCLKL